MDYDALHLANSIIRYTWTKKSPYNEICLLKLMKLCYITLGNYLAVKEDDFFEDEVYAWKYGPVIYSIWHEFKGFFLYNEITCWGGHGESFRIKNEDRKDKDTFLWKLVRDVCDKYKDVNPNGMVELTHGKGTPWYDHKVELLNGERNIIIKKEEIRKYYQNHKDCFLVGAASNFSKQNERR